MPGSRCGILACPAPPTAAADSVACERVQVACVHRWDMCVEATDPAAATAGAALLPTLHELLLSALARVEVLCRHQPRAAAVGLPAGVPTAIILHLLQCARPLQPP